ncbi:MAG: polymer-forming cytoskeletal protein [Thermoleophilia bacterium]|nr:polymer-forming cytoskeletal protein [Thermoleophilia bacterium]
MKTRRTQQSRSPEGAMLSHRRKRGVLRLTAVAALALMLVIALAAPALARDIVRLSGDVDIPQGEVVDGVVVMNGDITIAGTVTGNAFAANGDIRLLNGARVGGDAISLTGRVITEGTATIGGDRVEVGAGPINIGTPGPIDVPDPAGGFFGFGWIFMSLGAAGLGLFLVLISARSLRSVGEEIAHRPGRSALVGFLSIIGVPVLLVVLMISVIGIPLGLLLIPLLPLVGFYGLYALAMVAGERLLDVIGRKDSGDIWAMLAGVLLVAVVLLIPVLGWLLFVIAWFLGFGAAVSRMWEYFQGRRNGRARAGAPGRAAGPEWAEPAASAGATPPSAPPVAPGPYASAPVPLPPESPEKPPAAPESSEAPESPPPEPRYHI